MIVLNSGAHLIPLEATYLYLTKSGRLDPLSLMSKHYLFIEKVQTARTHINEYTNMYAS